MKTRLVAWCGLAAVAGLLLADASRAHGGVFRGPPRPYTGQKDSPNARPEVAPPTGPAGPTTGGPAPTSGGPVTGGPAVTGGVNGPTTGGPGVAVPASAAGTGGSFSASPDPSTWSIWWGFNKDAFLDLKTHVHRLPVASGSDDFFLGFGESRLAVDTLRPTVQEKNDVVVPALLNALVRSDEDDVITACLIALARLGVDPALLEERALAYLGHANQEVSETAILALGIAGDRSSAALLRELVLDTEAGRRAVGDSSVGEWRRSFAAYALGLLGQGTLNEDVRGFVVGTLARALGAGDDPSPDVDVACVVSMGLVPLERVTHPHEVSRRQTWTASVSRTAQVELLLALLDDDDTGRAVRAHVPGALARLCAAPTQAAGGEPDALAALTERVARDLLERSRPRTSEPGEVVAGCVLALGSLGDCDEGGLDAEIRERLGSLPSSNPDAQARRFSRIALAEVGGRRGSGDPTVGRLEVVRALSHSLVRGDNAMQRWSGLALGVLGHRMAVGGDVPPREVGAAVRSSLRDAKSPDDVGAFAIAAGILGDLDSVPVLREKLARVSQDDTLGYVAVALGLLGDRASIESIRELNADSEYRPVRLRETAVALGLLGDKGAVPELVDMLGGAKSLATQASLASALGRIGDRRAIDALVFVLESRDHTARARGFAAAALGIVVDDDRLPWNSHIAAGLNYSATTATLYDELGGRGLLTLL